jgi:hypothetical protein
MQVYESTLDQQQQQHQQQQSQTSGKRVQQTKGVQQAKARIRHDENGDLLHESDEDNGHGKKQQGAPKADVFGDGEFEDEDNERGNDLSERYGKQKIQDSD